MTEIPGRHSPRGLPAWFVFGAPLAVMTGIFVVSSRTNLPNLDGGWDIQSIAGHLVSYAVLGASLAVLFRWLGWNRARTLVAAIAIATMYGVTDELHQLFVPNRLADPRDDLADFFGATAGTLAALRLIESREQATSVSSGADRDLPADESS